MPDKSVELSIFIEELANRAVLLDGVAPVPEIPLEDSLLIRSATADGKEYEPAYLGDGLEITIDTITIGGDTFSTKILSATAVTEDHKVKTSSGDPTADYLLSKLKAGANISISESTSPTYQVEISASDVSGLTHPQVMSRSFLS